MVQKEIRQVEVIDSHTCGEPTRVVVSGGPDLGHGSMAERRGIFRDRFDDFRRAVIHEPRGADCLVGALLCEPTDSHCVAGVIYFDNVGVLNMCGHGTIGVVITLGHLGRIAAGQHKLETPVGVVTVEFDGDNQATIENVASYRHLKDIAVTTDEFGTVRGDVAWGGNWFFLVGDHGQCLDRSNLDQLTEFAWAIRRALTRQGITGRDGEEIDHIQLFGPPSNARAHGRNFVLCPGGAYDRSPCGTGTSARLACLAADDHLQEGQIWRQESIIGSTFEGTYRLDEDRVIPRITGSAYVTAETVLILDPTDPFMLGIR